MARMPDVIVKVVPAEAVRVGPDEVLVVHVGDDVDPATIEALAEHLAWLGLERRSLVFQSDVEFAVVKRGAGWQAHA